MTTRTEPPTEARMTTGVAARSDLDLRRLPLPYLVVAAALPVVLVVLLGLVLLGRAPASSATAIGRPAPDFTLADLDGNPVTLADVRGRPVILNFWASWCAPCVEEFPLLRDAAARHADDGLVVIGIVYGDRSSAAREFMERHGGTWPAAMDPGARVAAAYGVVGPPETYFIARDGTVAARQFGQISQASLDDKLAAILGQDDDHEEHEQ